MSGREPLTVAVNLTWLAPGRVGGSEEYLARQLAGLPPDAPIVPTLYCQPAFVTAHPELAARFATVPLPFARDRRGARILAEHTWLAVRTHGFDVVHHGGGTAPLVGPRPLVLTVHDLQYRELPEYFGDARRRYLDWMMPRSVRRAAVVATPTEFVRGTVVDAFGIDPARVVVVPHGVPEITPPGAAAVADARRRFGLGERPYVVYPAITHPHKGHRVLVELLGHAEPDLVVVMLGGAGAAEEDVRRAIAAARVAERVVRPGRVAAADRDALIAGAEALVFPSEYEGFGAPLVEAMALSVPVVCSDHPAVSEVVADAAVVVGERTGAAWAAGVADARRRRDELAAAGRLRRAAFTLEVSGRALAGSYRLAVAG